MFSRLLRLVLGLVIVVPRLACRPCPRLKGEGEIDDVGEKGSVGDDGEIGEPGTEPESLVMIFSSAALTPFAGTGAVSLASGVVGWESLAFASSEPTS